MNENTPVTIGRYRLSKTLGIGAFGKVKRESSSALSNPLRVSGEMNDRTNRACMMHASGGRDSAALRACCT